MKKKHIRVLEEIQSRIPEHLLKTLTKIEPQNPVAKKVFEAALLEPDAVVDPKKKFRIKAMLDAGLLDKEVEVIDTEVEKQIDEFISKEVALAVKLGRLPKKAPTLKLINNKGKNYAKRKNRQLKETFGISGGSEEIGDVGEENTG